MHSPKMERGTVEQRRTLSPNFKLLDALVAAAEVGLVAVDSAGRIAWVNVTFLTWAGVQALPDPTSRDFAETFPTLADQTPNQAAGQASGKPLSSGPRIRWMPGPDQGWIGQIGVTVGGPPTSSNDDLTGLGGRPELRLAFAEAVASGAVGRGETAYLTLDLDRFKEVNDTFGHPVGDELLQRVSRRVSHVVGSSASAFRLGGDEFGILLSDPRIAEVAMAMAGRLVDVLSRSFVIQGHEVQIGASIGVVLVLATAASIDAAYREADTALYVSKHAGGGTASLFEPRVARALEEQRVIRRDLRSAILLDQLELYYQPQLDLQTGMISSFGTSVRWRHPELGIVPATAFIPVAEKARFIAEIGRWTLREACRTAATWPTSQAVVVAVTTEQFTDLRFLATVFRALGQSRLAPAQLILEVTKSILLVDKEHVEATVAALHKAGVRVSLDGTGSDYSLLGLFSHLSLFGQHPFAWIKMDQSFVVAQGDGQVAAALIAGHCSRLGVQVLVEGVETVDQLDAARRQGCHAGQGPLIGRPVSKEAITSLLHDFPSASSTCRPAWILSDEPCGEIS